MTHHIIDTPRPVQTSTRATMYLKMERRLTRSEARQIALRRPETVGTRRLREFLRIERGRFA